MYNWWFSIDPHMFNFQMVSFYTFQGLAAWHEAAARDLPMVPGNDETMPRQRESASQRLAYMGQLMCCG